MPLRNDLLNPISGDTADGDQRRALYREIREARRQEDDLPQGDWQTERKLADYALVSKLTQENLAATTKDLQLAAWLTEASLHLEGFLGLNQGLQTCTGLVRDFWDSLYPSLEDDGLEARAEIFDWLSTSLEIPLKKIPLVRDGYGFLKHTESRKIRSEEQAQSDGEKEARAKHIAEGKLTPEEFDKAFAVTPKAFYLQSEKGLDVCLISLAILDKSCDEKFGTNGPSFNKLKTAMEDVRRLVHSLLETKRLTEPDPVEPSAGAEQASLGESGMSGTRSDAPAMAAAPSIVIPLADSEPPDRREAIARIAQGAAQLRQQQPYGPAPYLLMRGLRWGELRACPSLSDARLLEAPSTELRHHIRRLALDKKWKELLESAENAMSLPCSRAWLDLQRLVVTACTALGPDYSAIADAIRSDLRNLLTDIPQLLDANLLDETPAANAETRAWLKELIAPPAESIATSENPDGDQPSKEPVAPVPRMTGTYDPFFVAQDAIKTGNPRKALQVMQAEIERQRSGRGRFQRTLQLVELCSQIGNEAIAQPLIDDVAAAIDAHKLDDWEDSAMVASALATVRKISRKIQDNPADGQKLFERICRLDPARALHTDSSNGTAPE
jgi:type VI secretion system protein ImpA